MGYSAYFFGAAASFVPKGSRHVARGETPGGSPPRASRPDGTQASMPMFFGSTINLVLINVFRWHLHRCSRSLHQVMRLRPFGTPILALIRHPGFYPGLLAYVPSGPFFVERVRVTRYLFSVSEFCAQSPVHSGLM